MPVHRSPLFFPKKTYITVNKTVIVNKQCNHGGMGMNASIFGMMPMGMSMMSMGGNPLMAGFGFGDTFKNLFDGILSLFKKPEDKGDEDLNVRKKKEVPEDEPEVEPEPDQPTKVETPEKEEPQTPKIEYKIEDITQERVDITPRRGCGPWQYALFYVDANGKQVSGAIQTAIMKALINGGQKDRIENDKLITSLPQTINVGGQTYTLMDAATRAKTDIGGELGDTNITFAGKDAGATLSKSVNGGAWDIVGTYGSLAEAEAARKALEEGN